MQVSVAPPGLGQRGDWGVKAAYDQSPAVDGAIVEVLLPRRARPPWAKPDVLVLGDLPNFLRSEPGFHVLTKAGLRQLAETPAAARGKRGRSPVVAIGDASDLDPTTKTYLARLEAQDVEIVYLSAIAQSRCRIHMLDALPEMHRMRPLRAVVRRILDLAVAIPGVVVLMMLLPFLAAAIWLDDRGPIFYRQERVGRDGRLFNLLKLRSMRVNAETYGPAWARANDERITRVGIWLRRYKLDELPQFLNVIAGHMGVIGPRPERPFFVDALRRYVPAYDLRHCVRPGITGWGTLRVGYGNSIEAKHLTHQYDLYYMIHGSIWFDLKIVVKSIRAMLLGSERLDRFML